MTQSYWYSLPDHLSRFGVRAARSSLEVFLDSIGSPTSPIRARRHISDSCSKHSDPALPGPRPTCLPTQQPSAWLGYLPASPHRLTTTRSGPTLPSHASPRRDRSHELRVVSITGFVMGATLPVREYQPVVHRLRLSASP